MVHLADLQKEAREHLTTILYRIMWGALGGCIATASKFLAQDWYWYRVLRATRDFEAISGMFWTYMVLLAVLCFMAAVVAAAFQGERHPMKLLWLGVAAPALITTWLGGQYPGSLNGNHSRERSWIPSIVSTAYAAESSDLNADGFWRGVGIVFGIGKDQSRYEVVVGSYPTRAEATAMLEKIHKLLPNANAYTANPKPNNNYYGVIVGQALPFSEAQKLRDEVSQKLDIQDAYLSRHTN